MSENKSTKCKLHRVIDGDTLLFKVDGTDDTYNLRLDSVDAPELDQPAGWEAKNGLFKMLAENNFEFYLVNKGHGSMGRIIGDIYPKEIYANENLRKYSFNYQLCEEGLAWFYSLDKGYSSIMQSAQEIARSSKRGLWNRKVSEPVHPSDWRHNDMKMGFISKTAEEKRSYDYYKNTGLNKKNTSKEDPKIEDLPIKIREKIINKWSENTKYLPSSIVDFDLKKQKSKNEETQNVKTVDAEDLFNSYSPSLNVSIDKKNERKKKIEDFINADPSKLKADFIKISKSVRENLDSAYKEEEKRKRILLDFENKLNSKELKEMMVLAHENLMDSLRSISKNEYNEKNEEKTITDPEKIKETEMLNSIIDDTFSNLDLALDDFNLDLDIDIDGYNQANVEYVTNGKIAPLKEMVIPVQNNIDENDEYIKIDNRSELYESNNQEEFGSSFEDTSINDDFDDFDIPNLDIQDFNEDIYENNNYDIDYNQEQELESSKVKLNQTLKMKKV